MWGCFYLVCFGLRVVAGFVFIAVKLVFGGALLCISGLAFGLACG